MLTLGSAYSGSVGFSAVLGTMLTLGVWGSVLEAVLTLGVWGSVLEVMLTLGVSCRVQYWRLCSCWSVGHTLKCGSKYC